MSRGDERRELVPVIIAIVVLAIGTFFIWSDIRADTRSLADDAITTAVVTRAGATLIPSAAPSHLVVPQTTPVAVPSTVGRAIR
jgi:hypothetical protein